MAFFTKHTQAPLIGPITKDAIKAGSSDKSNFMNEGINGTFMLKNIRTVLAAAKIAVSVNFFTFIDIFTPTFLTFKEVSRKYICRTYGINQKGALQKQGT